MAAKKPRIVIIGAGMAGVAAANRLHVASGGAFELAVVEGGERIGGRINTSEFGGDRVELGATWIHGIGGSPVHEIASQIGAHSPDRPWECMDGASEDPSRFLTVAEGGFEPDRSVVEPVAELFKSLMSFAQGRPAEHLPGRAIAEKAVESRPKKGLSVGHYLRKGLSLYWESKGKNEKENEVMGCSGNNSFTWTRRSLEEGVFKVFENTQRTYTSAGDLSTLDYVAESEYVMCSGEEITIAKGYMSVVEHLASVLPPGLVQLGKKVSQIEWRLEKACPFENGFSTTDKTPVKIHFCDGSIMEADHVIVTVSLGVLKAGLAGDSGSGLVFTPALPSFKAEAIERLGFGVVNKLFVKLKVGSESFPFLRMVFGEVGRERIPWWMRRTAAMFPIYENSSVLLSWFAGEEALALEGLSDSAIAEGVSETMAGFLGNGSGEFLVENVLKTQWGNDPLFLGSYSYVAVGSSGDDLDRMAEPLPRVESQCDETNSMNPFQILFAGEATHRTHYSTTHGAYFSGLREANRLLKHYQCLGLGLGQIF